MMMMMIINDDDDDDDNNIQFAGYNTTFVSICDKSHIIFSILQRPATKDFRGHTETLQRLLLESDSSFPSLS